MKNYLNFETEIKNLEIELDKLKDPYNQEGLSEVDTSKISKVQKDTQSQMNKTAETKKYYLDVKLYNHNLLNAT